MNRLEMKKNYGKEFQGYCGKLLFHDCIAGLMAAFISLPLGLSFGISSHAVPIAGVVSFMVGTLMFSLFSPNPFQVQGSAALSVGILATISLTYGEQGIYLTGAIMALLMLLLAAFKLGRFIEKVPEPVVQGITMGIGYIIIKNQLVSIGQWEHSPMIIGILIGILLFLFLYPKKWENVIPGGVIVTVVSLVTNGVGHGFLPGPGEVVLQWSPMSLDFPQTLSFYQWMNLIFWAGALTLLFVVKDFSGGLMGEKRAKKKFQGNVELFLLGIMNLLMPLFHALPSTGAITVTQVSYKYKQRTRLTGIFMVLFLSGAVFFFPRYIGLIPIVALWGILIFTGIGMMNLPMIKEFIRCPKRNLIALITFVLIIFFGMAVGMVGGLIFATLWSRRGRIDRTN